MTFSTGVLNSWGADLHRFMGQLVPVPFIIIFRTRPFLMPVVSFYLVAFISHITSAILNYYFLFCAFVHCWNVLKKYFDNFVVVLFVETNINVRHNILLRSVLINGIISSFVVSVGFRPWLPHFRVFGFGQGFSYQHFQKGIFSKIDRWYKVLLKNKNAH